LASFARRVIAEKKEKSLSIGLAILIVGVVIASGIAVWALGLRRPVRRARLTADAMQELDISVNGRYSPDVIVVRQGTPLRLNFVRSEDNPCSEWVIFSEFNVKRRLPAYRTTPVVFTPTKEGEFLFTCQFGMYRGKLIVQKGNGKKTQLG